MNLLGISGSLRVHSSNTRLLQAAGLCMPEGVSFELADCLGDLPHFNPDLDVKDHQMLVDWVELVRRSDGLLVSSPEYASGYPGTLKNALDWLVQTDAHIDKPFMLLNTTDRSTSARESLIKVLMTMSGIHIDAASLTVPLLGKDRSPAEILSDRVVRDQICAAINTFTASIASLVSAPSSGSTPPR